MVGDDVTMSRTIDLDALSAAERSTSDEPVVVTFKGEEFTLPADLPWAFAKHMSNGDADLGLRALFGDDLERFEALGPSARDVVVLANAAARAYGFDDVGESSGPRLSSGSNGQPLNPTSNGSTG